MTKLPTKFFFYPPDAPEPMVDEETGKKIYVIFDFVEREKIDEEGHWEIKAESLTELIYALDNATKHVKFSYSIDMLFITENSLHYSDGYWSIAFDLGSWEEV